MMVVCDHIRQNMDKNAFNIVISHSLIVNAELSDSDRSARVGFATAVSKDVFEGFDYVALGHIHKMQTITDKIRYCGSPLKYAFGSEETQQKGVLLVNSEGGFADVVALEPLHDRLSIEGTYDEIMQREDLKDHYLRIRVTDRYAGLELVSDLRERFPHVLEVYGKGLTESESISALSVEELQTLDEGDIMEKFMAENFSYNPTPEQTALFRQVLEWSREEDDLG